MWQLWRWVCSKETAKGHVKSHGEKQILAADKCVGFHPFWWNESCVDLLHLLNTRLIVGESVL